MRRWVAGSIGWLSVLATAACGGSTAPAPVPSGASSNSVPTSVPPSPTVGPPTPVRAGSERPGQPQPSKTSAAPVARRNRPVIVVDPGHSPATQAVDPATGLNVSDYENEPEMRDVFSVAQLVEVSLRAAGYRVVMTKSSATARVSLGQRAAIANNAHAALALSIHDQAGSAGGIGFDDGNNTVYYQSVGTYRQTPSGRRVTFTDRRVAGLSKAYGAIFRSERTAVEGHPVRLQGNVGCDLGSRGLPAGNIWLVQLLAHVPWIYNEAGGNSAARSGLNLSDERRYAAGLVAGVEHCVPVAGGPRGAR